MQLRPMPIRLAAAAFAGGWPDGLLVRRITFSQPLPRRTCGARQRISATAAEAPGVLSASVGSSSGHVGVGVRHRSPSATSRGSRARTWPAGIPWQSRRPARDRRGARAGARWSRPSMSDVAGMSSSPFSPFRIPESPSSPTHGRRSSARLSHLIGRHPSSRSVNVRGRQTFPPLPPGGT